MILNTWYFQTVKGRVFPVWLICQDNPSKCHLTSWGSRFWLEEWKTPKRWWIYVVWLRWAQCTRIAATWVMVRLHLLISGHPRRVFCVYSTKNVLEIKVKGKCLGTVSLSTQLLIIRDQEEGPTLCLLHRQLSAAVKESFACVRDTGLGSGDQFDSRKKKWL